MFHVKRFAGCLADMLLVAGAGAAATFDLPVRFAAIEFLEAHRWRSTWNKAEAGSRFPVEFAFRLAD